MGHVEVEAPEQVFRPDDIGVELDLDTPVGHIAYIRIIGVVAGLGRYRKREEHVGSLPVEEVDVSVETVIPEAEFYTHVEIGVGLPCDLRVSFPLEHGGYAAASVIGNGVVVNIKIIRYVVVTLRAVGCFQFQHVHPRSVEPAFIADYPRCSHGPEVTPAMVRMEA